MVSSTEDQLILLGKLTLKEILISYIPAILAEFFVQCTTATLHNYTRNTVHSKTPRHFLFDKIIYEHFYELVITIAL